MANLKRDTRHQSNPRAVVGDNSSIIDLDERRAIFLAELTKFAEDRRCDEALSRQELSALPPEAQTQAQRQSLLDNLAHLYARRPDMDCAPGVLSIVTFMAGNRDGACSLSAARIAKFLSRSERAVIEAIGRLENEQAIIVERRPGTTSLMTPWVHHSFGQFRDALTWIMDVRAPAAERNRPGRPRLAAGPSEIPLKEASPLFTVSEKDQENQEKPANTPEAGFTPEPYFTPEGGPQIPLKPPSYDMNLDMKPSDTGLARERANPVTDADFEDFHAICNAWGQKRDAIILSPLPREITDPQLIGELKQVCELQPGNTQLLVAALHATLNTMRAAIADESNRVGPSKGSGLKSASSYFRKTLIGQLSDLAVGQARQAATLAANEGAAGSNDLKHQNAASGHSRGRNRRSSLSALMDEVSDERGGH